MQRIVFVLIAALVIASTAMAAPACPSQPPSTVTYDNYVDPSSITCDINNLEFSNFGFASSGGVTPSQIGVVTITTLGNEGFMFDPAFNVVNGQKQDATLTFEVTGLNGTLITDLGIGFNGSFQGAGSSSFTEEYCTAGFGLGTCHTFSVTNPPEILNQEVTFAGVPTLFISKDFNATAPEGTDNEAAISSVTNTFSNNTFSITVPEPRYIGVLLLGLAALIFVARRKSATAA